MDIDPRDAASKYFSMYNSPTFNNRDKRDYSYLAILINWGSLKQLEFINK